MGLTKSSTGNKVISDIDFAKKCNFKVTLAGNPNTGKSTIFNSLTKMHQHTGNWTGKTVENAAGISSYKNQKFLFVDIPGTYSLFADSEEEKIARDYISSKISDVTVIVVDATRLERNLNLVYQIMELTDNIVVCLNLIDEANKKGIYIDIEKLSSLLGVPVVATIARKKSTLGNLIKTVSDVCNNRIKCSPIKISNINNNISAFFNNSSSVSNTPSNIIVPSNNNDILKNNNIFELTIKSIFDKAHEVSETVCKFKNTNYNERDSKIDKILTSKRFGIPIMILFFCLIFWITIVGANYPSEWLSSLFNFIQPYIAGFLEWLHLPTWCVLLLIDGVYKTVTWIVSVMLPPMAIFFPLFTLLEDLGYLPRIAFNLDKCFKSCGSSGKQSLTMCMGFGCNAAGVIGCRIISTKRERLIAILTNNFVPCNGRFPFLITMATIFFSGAILTGNTFTSSLIATLIVSFIILIGLLFTFLISSILSKTLLKGFTNGAILELPPYRKPQICKILLRSLLDRTLFVLGRALTVAIPAGIIIWLLSNISIDNISVLDYIANFLNPFARLMGIDGYILTAFLLGLPANEIVLPIILMCYTKAGSLVNIDSIHSIYSILVSNGWTILTAFNVMLFSLLHFPCATTLLTIKKETHSWKWTFISFLIPTVCGILVCMFTTLISTIFTIL